MSFRSNSITPAGEATQANCLREMGEAVKKAVLESWAPCFHDFIFKNIAETLFCVLYAPITSRPNFPANILIGLLILKEMYQLSDKKAIETLRTDISWQYALGIVDMPKLIPTTKTLQRFRNRCILHFSETGFDLIHDCMVDLALKIVSIMEIPTNIQRMDSMMVSANTRKLGRAELLYTCVKQVVKEDSRNGMEIAERFQCYLDPVTATRSFTIRSVMKKRSC